MHGLPDKTLVLYVSPLKALSNDILLNLESPLAGIRDQLAVQGLPDVEIRTGVRTGDTPQSERAAMRKRRARCNAERSRCPCVDTRSSSRRGISACGSPDAYGLPENMVSTVL